MKPGVLNINTTVWNKKLCQTFVWNQQKEYTNGILLLEGYCIMGSWKELLNFSRSWNDSKGSKTLKIHLCGSPLVKELDL